MVQIHAIEERVKGFLLEHFPLARKRDLSRDDQLLGSGILDSLGVLEIVAFLEHEFGITIQDEDLLPENFRSIETLSAFVRRQLDGDSTH
jgi:acyl carrier protein